MPSALRSSQRWALSHQARCNPRRWPLSRRARWAAWRGGRFRIECVLRPAAMVVFAPSACFWKSVGQTASECMLPRAARGLPFRTIRVKCLVDGVRFGGLPGRHTPKAAGSRAGACTRWQNDQHFLEITHSRREWPPGHAATAATTRRARHSGVKPPSPPCSRRTRPARRDCAGPSCGTPHGYAT